MVSFDPQDGAEAAGIILHSTVAFNVMFSLTRTPDGKVIELASYTGANRIDGVGATRNTLATVPFDDALGTSVHLKISFDGMENATFSFSADGCTWQDMGVPVSVALNGDVDSQLARPGVDRRHHRPLCGQEWGHCRQLRRLRFIHRHQSRLKTTN